MPSPEAAELASLYRRKAGEDLIALRVLLESGQTSDAVAGFHEKAATAGRGPWTPAS